MEKKNGGVRTRLCLPPVHFCEPGPRLFFASVKVPNRIVTLMSQDAHIVLGLSESCTGPMFVSAKLEMRIELLNAEGWNADLQRRLSLERIV